MGSSLLLACLDVVSGPPPNPSVSPISLCWIDFGRSGLEPAQGCCSFSVAPPKIADLSSFVDEMILTLLPPQQGQQSSSTMSKIVVAIDFGTSRSAWAFTIEGRGEEKTIARIPQGSGNASSYSEKTETAVLLKSDHGRVGALISFGTSAHKKFIEDTEDEEDLVMIDDSEERSRKSAFMLFRCFKAGLCRYAGHQSVDDPVATADGGQKVSLLSVLTPVLRHFKEDVLSHLSKACDLPEYNITWVLTIPATYDDYAKRFMRHAAFEAGIIDKIDSSRLVLCLEPEAACLQMIIKDAPGNCEVGSKVMILDCGGGTVDITCHEILSTDPLSLKEILRPAGGTWGSSWVDKEFKDWLRKFLGQRHFERIQYKSAFYSLMEKWEDQKTQFCGSSDERLRLNFVDVATQLGLSPIHLQVRTWLAYVLAVAPIRAETK